MFTSLTDVIKPFILYAEQDQNKSLNCIVKSLLKSKNEKVFAVDSAEAIKKARIKNIKELFIVDEDGNRIG